MADANTSLEQQKADQEQIDQLAMEQTTTPLSSDETVDATFGNTDSSRVEERQNFVRGEQGLDSSELAEGEVASFDTGIVEITSSEIAEEAGTADIAAADYYRWSSGSAHIRGGARRTSRWWRRE